MEFEKVFCHDCMFFKGERKTGIARWNLEKKAYENDMDCIDGQCRLFPQVVKIYGKREYNFCGIGQRLSELKEIKAEMLVCDNVDGCNHKTTCSHCLPHKEKDTCSIPHYCQRIGGKTNYCCAPMYAKTTETKAESWGMLSDAPIPEREVGEYCVEMKDREKSRDGMKAALFEATHNIECVISKSTLRRQFRIRRAIAYLYIALTECENMEGKIS